MDINIKKIIDRKKYTKSRIPMRFVIKELELRGFLLDVQNNEIVECVLSYFLRHENFLKDKNVKNDNSFTKGLLIFGDYGVGKTMLFESLQAIGKKLIHDRGIGDLWFPKISCGSFVDNYMIEVKLPNNIRTWTIEDYYKGRLYIDDLGFEKLAFNSTELLGQLLFERHKKQAITFVTTNLKPSEITKRYGMRIGDRLPEMFNIINWQGKSYRK